jgi:fructokinase
MRIGIDLGGTKIEIIALDDVGAVRLRHRIPTPQHDYAGTLAAITRLVADAERTIGCTASVGIGTPGAICPTTGVIKNANSTWLNGRPLDADLSTALNRSVRLANDANCMALSEATDGAAACAATVFGVILGTGVGGGLVVNRQVLTGPNAIAGEWGHTPLPWPHDDEHPGPTCYCGLQGCIETFLSGPGMRRDYEQHAGDRIAPADIVQQATAGDTDARACLARYSDRLARSLSVVINIVDPDAIVLAGGLSNITQLYDDVPRRWGAYVFSDSVSTRLVRAAHGDSSGVRGAAWLWPAEG